MHSKDVVTQGDPIAMIAYGIEVLPLVRELWGAHPRVTQPWYADDAGAGVMFQQILEHFRGPPGAGTGPRLLPGYDQEHLGLGPREYSPGRGSLSGASNLGGDGTPVPEGLHWGQRGIRELVGGKDKRVDGVCGYPLWGFPKTPAVCLRRTGEVTTTGVGICA